MHTVVRRSEDLRIHQDGLLGADFYVSWCKHTRKNISRHHDDVKAPKCAEQQINLIAPGAKPVGLQRSSGTRTWGDEATWWPYNNFIFQPWKDTEDAKTGSKTGFVAVTKTTQVCQKSNACSKLGSIGPELVAGGPDSLMKWQASLPSTMIHSTSVLEEQFSFVWGWWTTANMSSSSWTWHHGHVCSAMARQVPQSVMKQWQEATIQAEKALRAFRAAWSSRHMSWASCDRSRGECERRPRCRTSSCNSESCYVCFRRGSRSHD